MEKFKMIERLVVITFASFSLACSSQAAGKIENNKPLIDDISYAKDSMAMIDNEITCLASDPDGDALVYEWSADGGQITASGSKALWISPGTMGEYKVSVNVKDGRGGESVQSAVIRVLNNADGSSALPVTLRMKLPSDEIVTANTTVKVGTVTKVSCVIDNSAGKKISYSWSADGGKFKGKGLEEGTCTTVYWTAPVEVKIHVLEVIARDLDGNEARGSVMFDVFCCPRN